MKKIFLLYLHFIFVNHYEFFSQELISNTNFIDLDPWTEHFTSNGSELYQDDTHTDDGSGSYKLISHGTYNSHIRAIIAGDKIEAGSHILSFYVKNIGPTTARVRPKLIQSSQYNPPAYRTTTNQWEHVQHRVSLTKGIDLQLRLYNNTNDSARTFLIDDVSLKLIKWNGAKDSE